MRNCLRATLLVAMLLFGGSAANAQISIGIRIGPPPAPRVVHVLLQDQVPSSCGWRAIGILWDHTISGMRVIGLAHLTRVLVGCPHITMGNNSLQAIGREIEAGLNTIIAGTTTMTETFVITIMTMTRIVSNL